MLCHVLGVVSMCLQCCVYNYGTYVFNSSTTRSTERSRARHFMSTAANTRAEHTHLHSYTNSYQRSNNNTANSTIYIVYVSFIIVYVYLYR